MNVQITFNGDGGTLTGPMRYYAIPPSADNFSVSMQTDLSSLPSGSYEYTINAHFAGKDRPTSGRLLHVNGSQSVFGRGWGLEGAQDLYVGPDGSVDLIDGNGNAQHFSRQQLPPIDTSTCTPDEVTERFTTIPGDTSSLVKLGSGVYERRLSDDTTHVYSGGKLQIVRDRYGNKTQYGHDRAGNLVSITDPVGLVTRFAYSKGHVSQIIDPAGRATNLSYNRDGDLTTITDPDGSVRNFQYDIKGHMTIEVNKLGGVETDIYGFHGRAIEAHRPDGTVLKVTPLQVQGLADPALAPATKDHPAPVQTVMWTEFKARYTQPNGNERVVTLNERGQVMEESDQLGLLHRFVRDGDGHPIEVTDADGGVTRFTYDDGGNTLTKSDGESAPGTATVMTYEPVFDQMTSLTDELGHTTHYTIDAHGNNVLTQQADGSQWQYAYLPQGMLRTQTGPLGHQTQYSYDAYGRLHKVTNADGTSRLYEYD